MMAIENFINHDSGYWGQLFLASSQVEAIPDAKRQALHHYCRRVEASGLSGSELLVEYLFGKYIKNHTHHSIRKSCTVALSFLRFLENSSQSIYALNHRDISAFVEFEQARGLKITSIINNLETLNAFLTFLVKQNVLPHETRQHKIRLEKPDALPRAIPREDMQLLLASISAVVDLALILLLLRTGMRIGELLKVKVTDIIFRERKVLIYQGEKNYQGRVVYYSKDAEEALQQWLQQRQNNSKYLFANQYGKPMSYSTAHRIMRKILQRARLEGREYSLHSLRHTFATDMLNAGMRIEVLQQLLGHQEIGVTMRYAKLADQTREQEYFQAMDCIQRGEHYEPERINNQLQKVFEEKKLLRPQCKKLPE
jgi:site-specific recombinase XerD